MPANTTTEPAATITAATLPEIVAAYVKACGSSDPLAPMHGAPFVQNGRIYLQLEGRGGAGKDVVEFTPTGLLPWVRENHETAPAKGQLKNMLNEIGFERKPFSYSHPERGSSSASYYSRPVDGATLEAPAERVKPERQARFERNPVRNVLTERIVPQMPEGNDVDTAKLRELWATYNAERKNFQRVAAEKIKKDGVPKDVLERKYEEKASRLELARERSHAAHAELLSWRRHMDNLNLEATRVANGDSEAAA